MINREFVCVCFSTGPGSLPPGLVSKRRGFDDGASDVSSNQDYIGRKF
jgi:calmodulin-regulated spectrin-associated protein